MPKFINLIMICPVIIGTGILISSISPVRKLITLLPHGAMRRNWSILRGLIIFFILGYFSYALVAGSHAVSLANTVVSMIFFLGACFVRLVNVLSLKTAQDLCRISALEHENFTDVLIDTYNRRYFDRRIEEEFERAYRYGLPLSILLLDIDHFKRVNDRYGHQAGDTVLINLARILVDAVRKTDIVFRYGGDEICIIATNTVEASTVKLAEHLRLIVDSTDLLPTDELKGQPPIHVTVSIGVSSLNKGIKTAAELFKNADIALYRAKSQGRNRVDAAVGVSLFEGSVSETTPVPVP